MAYNYRCLDRDGQVQEGLLNADSAEDARLDLEGRGWRILTMKAAETLDATRSRTKRRARKSALQAKEKAFEEKLKTSMAAEVPQEAPTEGPPPEAPRIPLKSLSLFMLQFRMLVAAGVSYYGALKAFTQVEEREIRLASRNLLYRVNAGCSLSQAMALNPRAFDAVMVNLVQLGERSGMMTEVLGRLGEALDKEMRRRARLSTALVYPIFVLGASLGMIAYLLYVMLPQFLTLFAETGMELPRLTRVVMFLATSPILPIAFLGAAALLGAWILTSRRNPAGRINLQKLRYETPFVGPFFRDYQLARICRDLGMLIRCGNPLSSSLKLLVQPTTGYYKMDAALTLVHDGVYRGGLSLAESMRPLPEFPPMLVQFVSAAEETGGVDDFLDRYADMTDQRLDMQMSSFLQLIEPAMMLFLGIVVGTLVLAAFLPVYQLVTAL